MNLPIPDDPALLGFTFFAQSFIRDPGAHFGWSHTNGLSATICA